MISFTRAYGYGESITFTLPRKALSAAIIAFKAGLPFSPVLCKVDPPLRANPYETTIVTFQYKFTLGATLPSKDINLYRKGYNGYNEIYAFTIRDSEIEELLEV